MSRVVLYGALAEQFGPEFNLSVKSPREAVRMLVNLLPGFKQTIEQGTYNVVSGDIDSDDKVELDVELLSIEINNTLHILPAAIGAKRGLFKTIIGTILVVASFFLPPLLGHAVMTLGLSLAFQGIATMLSPKEDKNKAQSFLLDGPDSTIQTGSPVPLIYGNVLASAGIISFEIDEAGINRVDPGGNSTGAFDAYNTATGDFTQVAYQPYE